MEDKVISLRVSKNLWDALEEAKWTSRKPKSEIVKEAIILYLKQKYPEIYERFVEKQEQARNL